MLGGAAQADAGEAAALFNVSPEEGRAILAAMGETATADGPLVLSRDCLDPVRLFEAVLSQWRVGFGGAYALDFLAVDRAVDWLGITRTPQLLGDIGAMEAEGLNLMAERR